MPHIRPNPPRPPPPLRPDPDDDDDRRIANRLIQAIDALTEWLKANRAAVTKADLNAATERILKAIQGSPEPELSPQDLAILNDLSAKAEARAKRLEALAAQTP